MKSKILIITTVISIFLISGCTSQNKQDVGTTSANVSEVKVEAVDDNFPYPLIDSTEVNKITSKVTTTADSTKSYDDLGEMVQRATAIFEGDVIKVAYFDKGGSTFTKYNVKITGKYRGDLQVGNMVTVIETGGITTAYNRIKLFGPEKEFPNMTEEESKKTFVQINWDNTPLTAVGEKVLLFANKDSKNSFNLPNEYYETLAWKDGKFTIEGTLVQRKVPVNQLTMSKQEIVSKVKNYIALEQKQ